MEVTGKAVVNGVGMEKSKDQVQTYYKADLYIDGVGAISQNVTAEQYVLLSKATRADEFDVRLKLRIGELKVPYRTGGGFYTRPCIMADILSIEPRGAVQVQKAG